MVKIYSTILIIGFRIQFNFGIPSDHSAIQLSLKFKNTKNNVFIDKDVD